MRFSRDDLFEVGENLVLDGVELYLRRGGNRVAIGYLQYSGGWVLVTWYGAEVIEKYDTLEVVDNAEDHI